MGIWIALAVIAVDRLTKLAAQRLTEPLTLLPGIVRLRYTENTGAAFSLLSGYRWLHILLPLVLLAGGYFILRRYPLGPWSRTGAALVAGGAIGNWLDRAFVGAVPDMIELLFVRFAVFNVADIAVCVGCALLGVSVLWRPKEWEREADSHAD